MDEEIIEKAIVKVKQWVIDNNRNYDEELGFRGWWNENPELETGEIISVIFVSYMMTMFSELIGYFAAVDPETLEILFIMGPHGYLDL
ncbi:MAG: hypothetical protein H6581_27195 [Bacteroidia bacterium]|nr:hypothetical protein [Bacteroidia bacterium]